MATTSEIRKALALAAAAYPNVRYPKQTVEIWCQLLADMPDGAVEAAALEYLAEANEFFPSPGVIRQKAIRLASPQEELTPHEAWAEVRHAMSRVGFYGHPEFSSSAIERSVQGLGGWKYLCSSENMVADRARFLEAYETFARKEHEEKHRLQAVNELRSKMAKQLSSGNAEEADNKPAKRSGGKFF